jgi:energy-coupling factor transporter ATP-binding protein EcfA2
MGNICVIGPRGSGKTTYLAALAYFPEQRSASGKKSLFNVQSLTDDARTIAEKAESLILEGASLPPTQIGEQIKAVEDLPMYSFKLEVQQFLRKSQDIFLTVRDYPGEVFDELDGGLINPLHEEFIDECMVKDVSGCLLLLSDWGAGSDRHYSRVMQRFIEIMDSHERLADMRVAVAMSKCERGELWSGRLDPETDLFGVHLPKTYKVLRNKITGENNLNFYAISTFGVLKRNDPRPNRTEVGFGGSQSILREPKRWQPYGMIAPLYWLSTGKQVNYDS